MQPAPSTKTTMTPTTAGNRDRCEGTRCEDGPSVGKETFIAFELKHNDAARLVKEANPERFGGRLMHGVPGVESHRSRPEPKVGISADGTFAGSMRAGLLIVCDLPDGFPTKDLSPQRIQVVVGFAYSAASATEDPGGFGLGDLGGSGDNTVTLPSLNVTDAGLGGLGAAPSLTPETPTKTNRPTVKITTPARRIISTVPLDGATRSILLVVCLVAWIALTHLGITRLRANQ